ncbi:hypothetical protein Dimus_003601 [Dionaea muscipula]
MLVHVDAVKEFYTKMTVIHLKKKDVVKSSVKGIGIEFDHERLATILGVPRRTGICSGENRRRDDDVDAPEGEAEEEEGRNQGDFDWEAVEENAEAEGESGLGEKFYDAEDENQGSPEVQEEIPAAAPQSSAQQKEKGTSGVDPASPTGRIPEVEMTRLQAEFERKRANRFLADLEKAKAENARLLALLHQAQSKPHP